MEVRVKEKKMMRKWHCHSVSLAKAQIRRPNPQKLGNERGHRLLAMGPEDFEQKPSADSNRRFCNINNVLLAFEVVLVLLLSLSSADMKVYDYVRYDLKEIAFPSSLPDPPHIEKRRKLSWKERFLVLKEASRLYAASWVRDIGPELRPYDYKKQEQSEDKSNEEKTATKEREPTTLEDLAVAARGGMETLRPALQRVYMTRASAYRDALRSFEGYQEGIQQVMEKKEDSKSQVGEDTPNKST
ncbi:UNVERIFIED_CONTAM: hypothetical protein Scaly_1979200 [Sesamum calycinum]|uniref:Embryo defective protein n=1 Tax=Sesamum calycinum TaxID=2727403 RepID=A0AAW2N3D6_9LAMI